MNRRIRERFQAAGIDLSSGATVVRLEQREELKAVVREVLEEMEHGKSGAKEKS